MYAFSSKSGSEPFRALGDLTWNDPIIVFLYYRILNYLELTISVESTVILKLLVKKIC